MKVKRIPKEMYFFLVLLVLIFTIPRSFLYLKLPFLLVAFLISLFKLLTSKARIYDKFTVFYYLSIISGAVTWSYIGLINGVNEQAVTDSLRLYFFYILIYFLITMTLSSVNNLNVRKIDLFMYIVGMVLSIMILAFAINTFFRLELIPEYIASALLVNVGVHDGYIQVLSHNVGMLGFFGVFTLSKLILSSGRKSGLMIISSFLVLMAILISGRRSVMLLIPLVPFLLMMILLLSGKSSHGKIKQVFNFLVKAGLALLLILLSFYTFSYEQFVLFFERLFSALNEGSEHPRTIQYKVLISGFQDNWVFGSGFGGELEYFRNIEAPWVFELAYMQLLFNIGLFGTLYFTILNATYIAHALQIISLVKNNSTYYSLVAGAIGMFMISATNPYVSSSFDFLVILSVIPFVINHIKHNRYKC
jgi:hypothetical protein